MTRQPQDPATEGTNNVLAQIFPDCKGEGRGSVCKLKKAFTIILICILLQKMHHFKLVIMSLILQLVGGRAQVMSLHEDLVRGGRGEPS